MSNDKKVPDVYVKGGTRTAKSEELYARRFHEGEERRDKADAEKRLSQGQQDVASTDGKSILMPKSAAGAVTYTNQFTEHPDVPKAYLAITYVDHLGQPLRPPGLPEDVWRCLADVLQIATDADPNDCAIIIVCPRCTEEGVKHQQDNQLRILRSNKYFDLQTGMGPPYIEWRESGNIIVEQYRSAGVVVESELFSCPDCGMHARFVNNTLRVERR